MNDIEENLNTPEDPFQEGKKSKKETNLVLVGHEKEQLDKMYDHYLQNHKAGTTKEQKSALSDQQKVRFMEDVLAIQFGAEFTSETVPAYYALDLVQFGVQNKIPDAIRLGERILS